MDFPWRRALVLAATAIAVSGCFSHRSPDPKPVGKTTNESAAILPVTPGQVRFVLDAPDSSGQTRLAFSEKWVEDYEQVARDANAILNALAADDTGHLIGPARLRQKLTGVMAAEHLHVYFDDPGSPSEAWKLDGLAKIGRRLGVGHLIVICPTVSLRPAGGSAIGTMYTGMNTTLSWEGRVTVTAERIGLPPHRSLQKHQGEAEFWGKWGMVAAGGYGAAIAIPYGFGKDVDLALEQATREALSGLLTPVDPAAAGQ